MTQLAEVLLLKPRVFEDGCGFLLETWQRRIFTDRGVDHDFVQDNHTFSARCAPCTAGFASRKENWYA